MEDCFGCAMFHQCEMKYEYADKCPCQKCLIKNICKEACDKYTNAYFIWEDIWKKERINGNM